MYGGTVENVEDVVEPSFLSFGANAVVGIDDVINHEPFARFLW